MAIPNALRRQAMQRLLCVLGVTLIITFVGIVGFYFTTLERSAVHIGDDSRQHFNDRLQALNMEWEREAICTRAGIEALRLMDDEKNRWPRLYAYLTAGETKEVFDALVIADAAGRVKFQHGAVPDDLPTVLDPVKRWFHDKAGEKVYRMFSQPLWLGKDGMGHLFLFKALDNALLYYLAYPHTELFVTYGNNVLAGSIGDIGKDRVSHGYSGSLVSKGVRYEQRVVPWDRRAEETDEETPLLILQQQIIPPFSVWESVLLGTAGLSFMLILLWAALGSWITDTVKRIMHLDSSADQFAREHAFSPATRQMLASVGEGHEDELADLSHSMKEMMETVLLREEEHRLDGDLLKRFNSLLKAQQETSIDGILVIDEKRKVLNYNSRFAEMWGIPEELVQTFDDRKLLDYILPFLKDAEEFISKVKYLYGNPYETSKDEILLNDGRIFDRYTGPVLLPEGIPYARIWYFRDVTESHRLKQELRDLSLNDELTGLYNRRGFLTFAQQQIKIADRTKKEMMLFFVDMDDLKLINDNLGHHTGDMAIKETAQVLRETFRDSDVIARFGGDEFAVLVSDASVDSENILKERLSKNIESHNEQANRSYKLSISVGTAVHDPAQPYSLDDLIGKADAFMYEQKMGKKRV